MLRPNPLTGTVLGIERKREELADQKTREAEFLNFLTDDGLESIPLTQIQRL